MDSTKWSRIIAIIILLVATIFVILPVDHNDDYYYDGAIHLTEDSDVSDFKQEVALKAINPDIDDIFIQDESGGSLIILNHLEATSDFSYGVQKHYDHESLGILFSIVFLYIIGALIFALPYLEF